jgi:hypothetical protein
LAIQFIYAIDPFKGVLGQPRPPSLQDGQAFRMARYSHRPKITVSTKTDYCCGWQARGGLAGNGLPIVLPWQQRIYRITAKEA